MSLNFLIAGTCSVLVDVEDINDVPPRWQSSEWYVEVSKVLMGDQVLASLAVVDPDITNHMAFRVTFAALYKEYTNTSCFFIYEQPVIFDS